MAAPSLTLIFRASDEHKDFSCLNPPDKDRLVSLSGPFQVEEVFLTREPWDKGPRKYRPGLRITFNDKAVFYAPDVTMDQYVAMLTSSQAVTYGIVSLVWYQKVNAAEKTDVLPPFLEPDSTAFCINPWQ